MALRKITRSIMAAANIRSLGALGTHHQPRSSFSSDGEPAWKPPRIQFGKEGLVPNTPVEYIIHFLEEMDREVDNLPGAERLKPMIQYSHRIASGIGSYAEDMSQDMSPDAKLLWEKMKAMNFAQLHSEGKSGKFEYYKEMSADVLQGNVLKMMVAISGAKSVLEVGTFTGFASLNMAEGLPSDGRLVTIEILPYFAQFAREFFDQTPHKDKIECITGDAGVVLPEMAKKGTQFDFIFVDGADEYTDYTDFVKIILDEGILSMNGLLAVDNALCKGASWMLQDYPYPEMGRYGPDMHDFNTFLKNDPRVEQVILTVRDGLTIARRVR